MKELCEKLAEQYAEDKSKAYYIDQNGDRKWYITERSRYSKEDFLAGYKAAQQWISVKDRLPEIPQNDRSDRVLLLRADGFIVIARIEKCVRFVRPLKEALIIETDNGDPIEEFTHWMPLFAPPKEEK